MGLFQAAARRRGGLSSFLASSSSSSWRCCSSNSISAVRRMTPSSCLLLGSNNNNNNNFTSSSSRIQHSHLQQKQQRFLSSSCYKVAIVGSGPSGCYTAKYLRQALAKKQQQQQTSGSDTTTAAAAASSLLRVDILERLPTPYGLVRYGVAPDHPEVKNVQNDFDQLFETSDDSNQFGEIRFMGNVQVGQHVSVDELRKLYDVVVLAYGCESDRHLPGSMQASTDENSRHYSLTDCVLSARQFVAWYNGHPDFVHIGKQVARALDANTSTNESTIQPKNVVVIGIGNVALDCARILAKGGQHLRDTDLASHCLPILGKGVAHVAVVGRRGHVQGAFTIKELRELTNLQKDGYNVQFHVHLEELEMGMTEASQQELDGPGGRPKQRIHKLLHKVAAAQQQETTSNDDEKHLQLRFLWNPVRFEARPDDPTRLAAVVCERTTLTGPAGQQKVQGTGEYQHFKADLAIVSIGYKSVALPGTEDFFDAERGVMVHDHGRVDVANGSGVGGLYAAGWLKRGPSGIIGTNIPDAKDTVATILRDLEEMEPSQDDSDDLESLLRDRGTQIVTWQGYKKLDLAEKTSKRSDKQPREKIVDIEEQLKVATS